MPKSKTRARRKRPILAGAVQMRVDTLRRAALHEAVLKAPHAHPEDVLKIADTFLLFLWGLS